MATLDTLIEDALDRLATIAQSDFNKTMETWDNHKSSVIIEKKRYERVVFVRDQVYSYINFGTDVRRVLLVGSLKTKHGVTSVGKTRPRVIGSAAGEKRGMVISRGFAFDGIQARNFDEEIAERIYNDVLPDVCKSLSDDLAKVFVETLPDTRNL